MDAGELPLQSWLSSMLPPAGRPYDMTSRSPRAAAILASRWLASSYGARHSVGLGAPAATMAFAAWVSSARVWLSVSGFVLVDAPVRDLWSHVWSPMTNPCWARVLVIPGVAATLSPISKNTAGTC